MAFNAAVDVLLIRHGEAVDDAPGLGDTGRWLTGRGRTVTRRVAGWLALHDVYRPTAIWTSPLVRAVQTAEIIAEACSLGDEVSVCAPLATNGNVDDVLRRLARYDGATPIALVGHEPSLSMLASHLLGDEGAWPGFKKSGVLGLRFDGKRAAFVFALSPKDLRVATDLASVHG